MLQSLGKITVPNPGTPVPVVVAAHGYFCNSILFETWPGNVGKVYIGISSGMKSSTGVDLVAILPIPVGGLLFSYSATIPSAPGGIDAAQFWVDADSANDSVLVSVAGA